MIFAKGLYALLPDSTMSCSIVSSVSSSEWNDRTDTSFFDSYEEFKIWVDTRYLYTYYHTNYSFGLNTNEIIKYSSFFGGKGYYVICPGASESLVE